jgi:hypothetical protein
LARDVKREAFRAERLRTETPRARKEELFFLHALIAKKSPWQVSHHKERAMEKLITNTLIILIRTRAFSCGLGWTSMFIAGSHFASEILAIHLAIYLVIVGYLIEAGIEFRKQALEAREHAQGKKAL